VSGATTGRVSGPTGFKFQNHERTATYSYVGYERATGGWYIERRTLSTGALEQATGSSAYSTAWTGRAGLTYA